jgi:DNA-binding NarL/FixJ family response regulator
VTVPGLSGSHFNGPTIANRLRRGAPMRKVRVLVADDNQAMLDFVTSSLAADFDVIRAVSDGGSAVTAATQLQPDLAVLDIGMPVLNGLEVTRRLRSVSQGTRVVVLTAYSDPDIVNAALAMGASAYVLKPRLETDLVRAINMAIEGEQFLSPGIDCEHPVAAPNREAPIEDSPEIMHPLTEIFQ